MKSRAAPTLAAFGLVIAVAAAVFFLWRESGAREAARQAQRQLERGIDLYHRKAYEEAVPALEESRRRNPSEWRTFFYRGVIQIEFQEFESAVPLLERALALNPTEPKILNALAVTYFRLGRLDFAKGYFSASLDLDPTNEQAKGLMEAMAKLQRRAAQAAEAGRQ